MTFRFFIVPTLLAALALSGCDSDRQPSASETANRAPLASAGPDRSAPERTAVALDGSGSSDPDGTIASHAWRQVSGTPAVALSGANTAVATFTAPETLEPRALRFELRVTDDAEASATDEVTITVTPVNDPPVAAPATFSMIEDTVLQGRLTASDPDSTSLIFGKTSDPANGSAAVESDGAFTYTPDPGFHGTDSFGFEACDDGDACGGASVSITVVPVNDLPFAADDTATTPEDTAVDIDVLANDLDDDADLDPATLAPAGVQNGTAEAVAGKIRFTPARDFTGVTSFTYTVRDTAGAESNAATVTVTVTVGTLKAGVAKAVIRVPVGTPLGGYLRPPVGGEYIPGLEALAEGDPNVLFAEFADFIPSQDDDGQPLAPIPDELRKLHSPYATFSAPSRGYYDSLIAKAVALHDGDDYVVLVKTDFIGMLDEVVQAVADRVQADTGIDVHEGLVLSATHSHDGPGALANNSVRYFWLAMDLYQPEVFERLVPQLAQVVEDALADLQPARFGHAIGQEADGAGTGRTLNSFRRCVGVGGGEGCLAANEVLAPVFDNDCDDDGLCNHDLRRRLGVLRVDTAGGAPLAVIMNYAAHGIAFDVENQFYSGDVLASAEREVEQGFDTPVVAMLVQNTGGNVSPRADGGPTLQRIERFGKLLAPQVRAIYDGIESFQAAPDLRAVSQRIILDTERLGYAPGEYPYLFGAAQCNNDLAVPFTDVGVNNIPGYDQTGLPDKNPLCLPGPPPDPPDLADNGVGENGAFFPQDTRLTAVKIGDATLLAQPGEPLSEYGVRLLKAARDEGFDTQKTFIWGYAQDHVGYILADEKADWDQGGTEGTTTFWGWLQGRRLREANVALLRALRDGTPPPENEFETDYFYRDLPFIPAQATPSLQPGRAVFEPETIERFGKTEFVWEGGDPVVDLPAVTLEVNDGSGWQPARRANGEIINTFFEMHLKYRLAVGVHTWTVELEAPKDWPPGTYRFSVSGRAQQDSVVDYAVTSAEFEVRPSPTLLISAPVTNAGNCEVTLAYTPRPDNYRLIDPLVSSGDPAPVREGTVTFSTGNTDGAPEIRGTTAVYAMAGACLAGITASGVDVFGNTTPAAGGAPGAATGDIQSRGLLGALGEFLSDLGSALLALLSGDFDAAQERFAAAFEELQDNGEAVLIGDEGSLASFLENLAANLAAFFASIPSDPAGTPAAAENLADDTFAGLAEVLGASHVPPAEEDACAPDNSDWESYSAFIGAMHEHSGYSDGWPGSTPADYYAAIRDRPEFAADPLDFAGGSEHSDNARLPVTLSEACLPNKGGTLVECANTPPPESPADPVDKWQAAQRQARAASDDDFTAFRGFEWTSDRFGHINVYFSKNDTNAKLDGGHAAMESFWTWFTTRAELGGGHDGLATFNHPGREANLTTDEPGFNWFDFDYVPAADLRTVGIEVFNRGSDFGTERDNVVAGHPGWYVHALDKGWHLGPIGAEDEHDQEWGTPTRGKTVLIARDNSEGALREALFARRFYAVGPNHNGLRLSFTADGEPMGARLARDEGAAVTLQATASEAGTLELVTSGGLVIASSTTALAHDVTADTTERWYFIRWRNASGQPRGYTAPIWIRAAGAYPLCGEWLAGDLHVHTTYSHDSWGGPDTPDEIPVLQDVIPGDDNTGPDEFFTLGHTVERQFLIASARGLDYLAITDHNDIRSQTDPGFGAFGVIPIHSYENSLTEGHGQMLGARRCYSSVAGPICNPEGAPPAPDTPTQAAALRVDDGVFQINHPAGESVAYPGDADWDSIQDGSYDDDLVPDTVEVWNIAWLWQPPAPSGNSLDDAVRYWEGWLDRGEKVAATGGSDNHWLSTTAVQGNGQPTTWVFATERSERGVIEALRVGRTYITHQPPLLNSPRLLIEADADGDGVFETMAGGEAPRDASFRVRAANAPAALLRIVTSGGARVFGPIPVVTPEFEFRFTPPVGATWVRAELVEPDAAAERASICDEPLGGETTYCRNRLAVLAMTSAIYLQ